MTKMIVYTDGGSRGNPGPAAAAYILKDAAAETTLFVVLRWTILYILPFVTIAVGVLMVTRIRYPHVVNQYLRGRKPMTYLVWTGILLGMIYLCGIQLAMVLSFGGFAVSDPYASGFYTYSSSSRRNTPVKNLEEKLARKNEVLSELMEEHVALKKSLGEI